MSRAINEIGNRYGKLVVLGLSAIKAGNHLRWVCECDCGSFSRPKGSGLRNGNSTSCGCKLGHNRTLPYGKASFNALYKRYKTRAKKRGVSFLITKQDFKALTKKDCSYCGEPPAKTFFPRRNNGGYVYNGIDRVDNTLGYEKDNIAPCCHECNMAKGTMTCNEFLTMAERISEHAYQI